MEQALSKLRHLYENMVNGGVKDSAAAKRIAEGLLSPAIQELEDAARAQAPVAVEPVAWRHTNRLGGVQVFNQTSRLARALYSTNEEAMRTLHLMTQRDQPYGSQRRCCERCGLMLVGRPDSFWDEHAFVDDEKHYTDYPAEGAQTCMNKRKEAGQ